MGTNFNESIEAESIIGGVSVIQKSSSNRQIPETVMDGYEESSVIEPVSAKYRPPKKQTGYYRGESRMGSTAGDPHRSSAH